MGLFSFFKKNKNQEKQKIQCGSHFTKDFGWDIINHSTNMIAIYTKEDGWIDTNELFLKTFNFSNIKNFRQEHESIRELFISESEDIYTEDDKSWLDYIKKYKKSGYDIAILSPKKKLVNINIRCYTILHKQEFYILELKDSTKLHQAKLKIKEVEKQKTEFLTNIAHELRTPMNSVLGFVGLLEQTKLEKQQQEYMRMISRSSKNLMMEIESLLDFSQLQEEYLKVNNSLFSISQEMEVVAYNCSIRGQDRGIKVLTFIDPKLPLEIESDLRKINQIINFLVQNAIESLRENSIIILEIKLLKKEFSGKCNVSFSIKNNDESFTKEQLKLILSLGAEKKYINRKAGINLTLANKLINLLGGEIKIQTEKHYGSYFNFVLNFQNSRGQLYKTMPKRNMKILYYSQTKAEKTMLLSNYLHSFGHSVTKTNILDENIYNGIDALYVVCAKDDYSWIPKLNVYVKKVPVIIVLDEGQKFRADTSFNFDEIYNKPLLPSFISKHLIKYVNQKTFVDTKETDFKNNARALVVEDNIINQKLIQLLLENYKISVSIASDGVEAIDKCEKNRYDIVFMDIEMPKKNGIIATKEIKEKAYLNNKTPIIALTAMAMEGDREMLLRAGMDDYISKPLSSKKLKNILEKYIKYVSV